jgi:hypothetical protein
MKILATIAGLATRLLGRAEQSEGPKPSLMRLDDSGSLTAWFSQKGSCPDCGGLKFLDGPRGGLSQNMKCGTRRCGAEFNVARYEGRVFHVDRLERESLPGTVVVRTEALPRRTLH